MVAAEAVFVGGAAAAVVGTCWLCLLGDWEGVVQQEVIGAKGLTKPGPTNAHAELERA